MAIKRTIKSHRVMKKGQTPERTTVGTSIAEKAREKANSYSEQKRDELLKKGLAWIYGNNGHAKTHANRG